MRADPGRDGLVPTDGAGVVHRGGAAGADPAPALLDATDGRGWAAEVHSGPLQLVAALSTYLQLLRGRLGETEAARIDQMLELAGSAIRDLRLLIGRLEAPDGSETLAGGLAGSAERVLGAGVDVADRSGGALPAPVREALLGLGHRALVEMRRMGAREPGRIEVDLAGGGVVVRIAAAAGGERVRATSTLGERARLAGGSAAIEAGAEAVATIRLPLPG